MNIPVYDHEIIELLAEQQDLTTAYVSSASEMYVKVNYSATIGHKFTMHYTASDKQLKMIHAQEQLLRSLASQDCIIVGRAADVVLSDLHPFNIFVYADNASKVKRCLERTNPSESLTSAQIQQKMRAIDRQRSAYHDLFSDTEWGSKENYHLCVNTSGVTIKYIFYSDSASHYRRFAKCATNLSTRSFGPGSILIHDVPSFLCQHKQPGKFLMMICLYF